MIRVKFLIIILFFLLTKISCAQEKTSYTSRILNEYSTTQNLDINQGDTLIVKIGKLFNDNKTALILRKDDEQEHFFHLGVFKLIEEDSWKLEYSDQVELGFYLGIKLRDLNKDGIEDIIINAASGRRDDILYLSVEKFEFSRIRGLREINLLYENEDYIYTYAATGCADLYWESSLILINGSKLNKVAKIEINECSDMKNSYLGYISRGDTLNLEKDDIIPTKEQNLTDYWKMFIEQYLIDIR